MPKTFAAHSRASGNSNAGSPLSRGRAGRISVGAFAAALLPLLLRPAGATEPDLAFGAFQTGHYLTAFGIAINRIELKKDPKAMTLLGELYAGGLGVPQNDVKAADWYKLAADRGDREAMFALAMFRLRGRAGPRDRDAGAKWLAAAAKLGHPLAAYDLALLYMEGQLFPQDFTRAAELLRAAAQAGLPEAQYALGTLYKQGRGVAKDMKEATRLWGLAALATTLTRRSNLASPCSTATV
jgi:TPR repeat protein